MSNYAFWPKKENNKYKEEDNTIYFIPSSFCSFIDKKYKSLTEGGFVEWAWAIISSPVFVVFSIVCGVSHTIYFGLHYIFDDNNYTSQMVRNLLFNVLMLGILLSLAGALSGVFFFPFAVVLYYAFLALGGLAIVNALASLITMCRNFSADTVNNNVGYSFTCFRFSLMTFGSFVVGLGLFPALPFLAPLCFALAFVPAFARAVYRTFDTIHLLGHNWLGEKPKNSYTLEEKAKIDSFGLSVARLIDSTLILGTIVTVFLLPTLGIIFPIPVVAILGLLMLSGLTRIFPIIEAVRHGENVAENGSPPSTIISNLGQVFDISSKLRASIVEPSNNVNMLKSSDTNDDALNSQESLVPQ